MMRFLPHTFLLLLLGLPFCLSAQTDLRVAGGIFALTNGTQLSVSGDVVVNAGATFLHAGELRLRNSFENNGDQRHNAPADAVIRYTGSSEHLYKAGKRDTLGALYTNGQNLKVGDTLYIAGTLSIGGRRVRATLPGNLLILHENAVQDFGTTGYVDGQLGIAGSASASKTFWIGNGDDHNRVTLQGIGYAAGPTPIMVFAALPTPVPSGSRGNGISRIEPEENVWYGKMLRGSLTTMGSIMPSFSNLYGVNEADLVNLRVARSAALINGTWSDIGNAGVDIGTGVPVIYAVKSDPVADGTLGYFALGRCAYYAGLPSLITPADVCELDSIRANVSGVDPAVGLQWLQSTDGGTTYTAISGQTSRVLYTVGTLSPAVNAVALATIANACGADTTDRLDITIRPAARMQVKLLLEGAYQAGGTMRKDYYDRKMVANLVYSLLDSVYSRRFPAVASDQGGNYPKMYRSVDVPANAVDVVRIEIWDAGGTAMISESLAWLMPDGSTRPFVNGLAGDVAFCGFVPTPDTEYRVAVRHRNHLGAISAGTYEPGNLVDFTLPGTVDAEYVRLFTADNKAALLAGNAVDNLAFGDVGAVNSADRFVVIIENNALPADARYRRLDLSMDALVNATDRNQVERNAFQLKVTNIPN
ncbi:MAG: hypothetical protein LW884_07590 [Bacteroidetes bacterium]|jgi:hypothetical protein|nr:hypothetical protein [Bacteroidota bacterium]